MALRKSLLLAVSTVSILASASAFANDTVATDAAAPAVHKAHKGEHKGHAHKGEHKGAKHAHPKKDQSAAKDVVAPATEEAK